MTENQCRKWIVFLIETDRLHEFYVSKEWRRLRKEILKEQKNECQICKARGFYTKANHVHHVQYVRNHPELALSKTYIYNGQIKINLLAVCHDCHEELHGYRAKEKKEPLTEEKW